MYTHIWCKVTVTALHYYLAQTFSIEIVISRTDKARNLKQTPIKVKQFCKLKYGVKYRLPQRTLIWHKLSLLD
jgi:hypothetical protein